MTDYDSSFDRLRDILDEAFGMQPVMSDAEALTFLESKLHPGAPPILGPGKARPEVLPGRSVPCAVGQHPLCAWGGCPCACHPPAGPREKGPTK